jgi:hypothetical protein
MNHWLAEFVFTVGGLKKIGLINDVDQMLGLGDTPKHGINPHAQFPAAANTLPIKFTQVGMTAFVV